MRSTTNDDYPALTIAALTLGAAIVALCYIGYGAFIVIRDTVAIFQYSGYDEPRDVLLNMLFGTPGRAVGMLAAMLLVFVAIKFIDRPASLIGLMLLFLLATIFTWFCSSVESATDYPNTVLAVSGDYVTIASNRWHAMSDGMLGFAMTLSAMVYDNRQWLFDGAVPFAVGFVFGRRYKR